MDRYGIRKNNKGAALILVIGCVALLSVIGALLLAKTANNRAMKDREEKAQHAFYEAEDGSQMMVSALENCAQDALKSAYVDMLMQYSALSDDAARQARFASYFEETLKSELSGGVSNVLQNALGLSAEEYAALDITVSFEGDIPDPEPTTDAGQTQTIRIPNVTFSYIDPTTNTQASLSTDICVSAEIPSIDGSMSIGSVGCAFTDFALITGGSTSNKVSTGGATAVNINGNVYVGANLETEASNANIIVNNAEKILVKGSVKAQNGKIELKSPDDISEGHGVWADGIIVEKGTFVGKSNFYIADDLDISGIGSSVTFSGNGEYIGYSGNDISTAIDPSAANSAITINTASNITLDMSSLARLVLRGNSYIYDTSNKWQGTVDTKSGILQGESVAYKDIQSMYLVPGDCLPSKSNPMSRATYDAMIAGLAPGAHGMEMDYFTYDEIGNEIDHIDFSQYLAATPYVARYAMLEAGASELVYLYLNFKDQKAASKYVTDYLLTEQGQKIKKQIESLGVSTIKLAQENHTVANALIYNGTDAEKNYFYEAGDGITSEIRKACVKAERHKTNLFSTLSLKLGTTTTITDIVTQAILAEDAFSSVEIGTEPTMVASTTMNVGGFDREVGLYVINVGSSGTYTISDTTAEKYKNLCGILLVNGKLKITAASTAINGLVIATEGVECYSAASFTAKQDLVEALLQYPEVADYFRGYAVAGGNHTPFNSSEAVNISFENWKKN